MEIVLIGPAYLQMARLILPGGAANTSGWCGLYFRVVRLILPGGAVFFWMVHLRSIV